MCLWNFKFSSHLLDLVKAAMCMNKAVLNRFAYSVLQYTCLFSSSSPLPILFYGVVNILVVLAFCIKNTFKPFFSYPQILKFLLLKTNWGQKPGKKHVLLCFFPSSLLSKPGLKFKKKTHSTICFLIVLLCRYPAFKWSYILVKLTR